MPAKRIPRITCICQGCGKFFEIRPKELQHRNAKFCSLSCASKSKTPKRGKRLDVFWNRVNKEGPIQLHCQERGHCWEHLVKYPNPLYAWEDIIGPKPDGMFILHHCDNPKCVRADPDPAKSHLYLGDHKQNMIDMVTRGRSAHNFGDANGAHKHPERMKRGEEHHWHLHPESQQGENNPRAIFTWAEVNKMRESHTNGKSVAEISKELGRPYMTIYSIISGGRWKTT